MKYLLIISILLFVGCGHDDQNPPSQNSSTYTPSPTPVPTLTLDPKCNIFNQPCK